MESFIVRYNMIAWIVALGAGYYAVAVAIVMIPVIQKLPPGKLWGKIEIYHFTFNLIFFSVILFLMFFFATLTGLKFWNQFVVNGFLFGTGCAIIFFTILACLKEIFVKKKGERKWNHH